MSVNPDFIVASYNSAFRATYDDNGKTKGIFTPEKVGACTGAGSEWAGAKNTCRPQLHAKNVGTYLFKDACEDKSLRPTAVSEETVYEEMRTLGKIFKVDAEKIITSMKSDFDTAAAMVSSSNPGSKLKAVWIDCVGRCCKDHPVQPAIFVGGASGAPGMLMKEAGLENAFASKVGSWVCVSQAEVVAAAPDVMVMADAAWDTALSKITYLYNHSAFCGMDALKGARFVQIPFSASTLSPRNGPAALDLAIASLHVRRGTVTPVRSSGVSSFAPATFLSHIKNLKCTLEADKVKYEAEALTGTTVSSNARSSYAILPGVLASLITWFS